MSQVTTRIVRSIALAFVVCSATVALAAPSEKDMVKAAQVLLFALRYQPSLLGNLDARTTTAIRAFQEAEGMPKDGMVTPYLLLRLAEALSNKCANEPATRHSVELPRPSSAASASGTLHPNVDGKVAIRSFCSKKWGTNWEMIEHCEKEEIDAMETVHQGNNFGVPFTIYAEIREQCERKWWPQFTMQLYCQREQANAYKRTH